MFSWLNFILYIVTTAATPGPNNIMSMSNGSKLGFKESLPFNYGIGVGFSIVMILCTALCKLLNDIIPMIETPMLIIGALYILHLAWGTFKSNSDIEENYSQNSFLSGLFLQFINPKIYIYGIMSMEAYILPYYSNHYFALFSFAMLLAFIGFLFTLCWSAFGSIFKLLFIKYVKIVNTIMSILLVYCAISLFF